MPEYFEVVNPFSAYSVKHEPIVAAHVEDFSVVKDRIGKAHVTTVSTVEEIVLRSRAPFVSANLWQRSPRKRALRDRLVESVNSECIVGTCSAVLVARLGFLLWCDIDV